MKFLVLAALIVFSSQSSAMDESAIKAEASIISKQPKKLHREKDQLVLSVGTKGKKVFKDKDNPSTGSFLKTIVVDYIEKDEVVVLEQSFYEGGQFLVVTLKDGKEIKVPTKPVWSPDQNTFVSTNDDESDYTDNRVVIGTCKTKKCTQIYSEETHAGEPKWVDAATVEFEKRNFNAGTGVSDTKNYSCKIDLKKNKATCR